MNSNRWMLENTEEGSVPPLIEIKDSYYDDVQNCIDSLADASTKDLKSLTIKSPVNIPAGSILKGDITLGSSQSSSPLEQDKSPNKQIENKKRFSHLDKKRSLAGQVAELIESQYKNKVVKFIFSEEHVSYVNKGEYIIQVNPARHTDRRTVSGRPGCFLCPSNMPKAEKGIIYTPDWTIYPNPLPYERGHFVLVRNDTKSYHPYQIIIDAETVRLALSVIYQLVAEEGCFDYKISFNGVGAAASSRHFHYQGFRATLPVEEHKTIALRKEKDLTIGLLKDYPVLVFVFESGNKGKVAQEVFKLITNLSLFNPGVQIPYNILFDVNKEGIFRIYVYPRRAEKPSVIDNNLMDINYGILEMSGYAIVYSEEKAAEYSEEALRESLIVAGWPVLDGEDKPTLPMDIFLELEKQRLLDKIAFFNRLSNSRRSKSSSSINQQDIPLLPGLRWGFYVAEIPESKVGGIGDVSQGLPDAILRASTSDSNPHKVYRVTPYYKNMLTMTEAIWLEEKERITCMLIPYQGEIVVVEVYKRTYNSRLQDYFIVNDHFSYPYKSSDIDNPEAALREAVVYNIASALLVAMGETNPEVMFLADWQAGFMPAYLREHIIHPGAILRRCFVEKNSRIYSGHELLEKNINNPSLNNIIPLSWINNEAYMGKFDIDNKDEFEYKTGLSFYDAFEWDRWGENFQNFIVLLKLGVETINAMSGELVTVSGSYAEQIMGINLPYGHFAGRLNEVLRGIGVTGILNGVPREWRYLTEISEKEDEKIFLQSRLNLERGRNKKIIFMISRLVTQKGVSLIVDSKEEFKSLLGQNSDLQLIIGGKPEKGWIDSLHNLQYELEEEFLARVLIILDFLPEDLVELIFKAGDINLFPSLYEPAGTLYKGTLNMVLTVARLTGGLVECAVPVEGEEGNAVVFSDYHPMAFMEALREGVRLVQDEGRWHKVQRNMIQTVKTWDTQFIKYARIVKDKRSQRGFSESSSSLLIFAHRGAQDYGAKENTARAFKDALRINANGIELDTQITKDKIMVVYRFKKVAGLELSGLSYEEVISLDKDILTLEEVFSLINGRMIIQTHLVWAEGEKEESAEKLVSLISKYKAQNWVIVASVFEQDLININEFAKKKDLAIATGTGESPAKEDLTEIIRKSKRVSARWVALSVEEAIGTPEKIDYISREGLLVSIWGKRVFHDQAEKILKSNGDLIGAFNPTIFQASSTIKEEGMRRIIEINESSSSIALLKYQVKSGHLRAGPSASSSLTYQLKSIPAELESTLDKLTTSNKFTDDTLSNLFVAGYQINVRAAAGSHNTDKNPKAAISTETVSLLVTGYLGQSFSRDQTNQEVIAYLYMLAYFRSLPIVTRKIIVKELNSLTRGQGKKLLGNRMFKEVNLELEDILKDAPKVSTFICLRDQVVNRVRALRIAAETSGLNIDYLGLVAKDSGLFNTVLGLRHAAVIEADYSPEEKAILRTLLNIFDHIQGAAINITSLVDGKFYVYDEYVVKEQTFYYDNKQHLSLTNEGVEHLIRLQEQAQSGPFYELSIQPSIVTETLQELLIEEIAKPLIIVHRYERFTCWDMEKRIWRTAGLGSRFYELERPQVDVTAMATIDRPTATFNQVEAELENYRIFNRRVVYMLIDDSGVTRPDKSQSPNYNLDIDIKNLNYLTSTYGDSFIHLTYENRNQDEAGWAKGTLAKLQEKLDNKNLDPVFKTILIDNNLLEGDGMTINQETFIKYIGSNIFKHISGVRNYTFLKALGYRIMSEDDDAPAETYVVAPEDLEHIRSQRKNARSQAMSHLLEEASKIFDTTITSERRLYGLWANQIDQQTIASLEELEQKYFGYSQDGILGLIPQAMEQIRTYTSHYMDKRYKRTHQRYEGLNRPQAGHDDEGRIIYEDMPKHSVSISDFYYSAKEGRMEKEDGKFMVYPVNILGSAKDLGKKVKDTTLATFSNSLRGTITIEATDQEHAANQERTIEYIAYPFINDHDISGMAQFIRYLLPQEGQVFIAVPAPGSYQETFINTIEHSIKDYVAKDGEAIALWAVLSNVAQQQNSSYEMDGFIGKEANKAPKEVYGELINTSSAVASTVGVSGVFEQNSAIGQAERSVSSSSPIICPNNQKKIRFITRSFVVAEDEPGDRARMARSKPKLYDKELEKELRLLDIYYTVYQKIGSEDVGGIEPRHCEVFLCEVGIEVPQNQAKAVKALLDFRNKYPHIKYSEYLGIRTKLVKQKENEKLLDDYFKFKKRFPDAEFEEFCKYYSLLEQQIADLGEKHNLFTLG
ncbi:MAG: DUF4922 domain-containing protein, partial [Candidatus Omnitrophica bacterium]|nr:DUF4922 domain-containing protein [Candidatus Omnitrophota bacterium]